MRNNINDNMKVQFVNEFGTAITDGNFPASGSYIEVGEFQHFAYLVKYGTLDSALTAQVRQDTSATETASIKDITSAVITIGATDDGKWATIEVETARLDSNNLFHFVTLAVSGAAGANDFLDLAFLGWGARTRPVTQVANYDQAIEIIG